MATTDICIFNSSNTDTHITIIPWLKKRPRNTFRPDQIQYLLWFLNNRTKLDYNQLAIDTGLTKHQVRIWYQNRRAQQRKKLNGGKGKMGRSDAGKVGRSSSGKVGQETSTVQSQEC